jgi:hypothetical protein
MKRSTAILAKKGVMGHADNDGDAKALLRSEND